MVDYVVNYSETENLAMQYAALDIDEWIQNAAHERARIAIDEIVKIAVEKYIESGQQIPSTKEEIVQGAFDNGWVKTVAQVNAERTANT